jgi:hypothetical protein
VVLSLYSFELQKFLYNLGTKNIGSEHFRNNTGINVLNEYALTPYISGLKTRYEHGYIGHSIHI